MATPEHPTPDGPGFLAAPAPPVRYLPPEETVASMMARLPPWTHGPVKWLMSHWPGRVALRTTVALRRLQIFDRAMTIAAQIFTSVFPILIMVAVVLGADRADWLVQALDLPSAGLLDELQSSSTTATFGVLGGLMVLASATSLSRATTRAYEVIWYHDYGPTRWFEAWRWVVAVLVIAGSFLMSRVAIEVAATLPPTNLWGSLIDPLVAVAVAVYLPWLLTSKRIRVRVLLPGALLFGLAAAVAQPVTERWLPQALESSLHHYGSLGVAFTYIGWLYVIAWVLLATAALGEVIATDEGGLGRYIRRPPRPKPGTPPVGEVAEPGGGATEG
ncbi:MAG TPA: YhjD/YihY/BrkB family envelope integrity protein [Nocardioides sp.]|uniref:YhjD/YihY/BrkB family envelope integrity protein n=1 Tax=Nocardioides sp. TaxID=35761 RepID=UPI002B94DFEC|nr:YhjD/YihY/BrkB family envelope integrity protein [Nocardioides sp.]HQR28755.1 YhjD/YihY/BrkB family envelope integrity protein [Nocardioides sp.]